MTTSRKRHEPTDKRRTEVRALVSFGIPEIEIAAYIGITAPTLRKYYREEIKTSATTANATVAKFLFRHASGTALNEGASHADCLRAGMFWMKTRAGWKEVKYLNADGSEPLGKKEKKAAAAESKSGKYKSAPPPLRIINRDADK